MIIIIIIKIYKKKLETLPSKHDAFFVVVKNRMKIKTGPKNRTSKQYLKRKKWNLGTFLSDFEAII